MEKKGTAIGAPYANRVTSLPGEHLFQASALPRNRMRPAIFHAFGKAKVGAQAALRELELQGWETLPIAILGMPNLPPAWVIVTWKPVGGCTNLQAISPGQLTTVLCAFACH